MSRPKITVVGKLRYSESDGLKFRYEGYYPDPDDAVVAREVEQRRPYGNGIGLRWADVFDRTVFKRQWPGLPRPVQPSPPPEPIEVSPTLEPQPSRPWWRSRTYWETAVLPDWRARNDTTERAASMASAAARAQYDAALKAWEASREATEGEYHQAIRQHPSYQELAKEFLAKQQREPQRLPVSSYWAYRDKVLLLESTEPAELQNDETDRLYIKQFILRQERDYQKVAHEVEALENLEKLGSVSREPIPEAVRLFVWQRDKGQCVRCQGNTNLEFDHIIRVVAGGANTARNLQLLCESCNRSKGATI
jgi:hypothetical protein